MSTIKSSTTTTTAYSVEADTTGALVIQTGATPTTAVSIDASQNVNFAGTAQRITGDFSGAVASRLALQTSTTDGNTIINALPNGTAVVSRFRAFNAEDPTNASFGDFGVNSSQIIIQSSFGGTGTYLPMTFFTGGSESLRLSATTKAVILAGGSTSANGTGITFPATQSASSDANTLDDYEEGTWTPSIGGSATYINQFGRYTKIGNKVFIEGFIEINVLGTGSTGNISGLPFSSIATSPLGTASVGFFAGAAGAVAYLSATIATSSTQVSLRHVAPGGGTAMGATTFFANGAALFFTANYTA
jgi:hypothetical protein